MARKLSFNQPCVAEWLSTLRRGQGPLPHLQITVGGLLAIRYSLSRSTRSIEAMTRSTGTL